MKKLSLLTDSNSCAQDLTVGSQQTECQTRFPASFSRDLSHSYFKKTIMKLYYSKKNQRMVAKIYFFFTPKLREELFEYR